MVRLASRADNSSSNVYGRQSPVSSGRKTQAISAIMIMANVSHIHFRVGFGIMVRVARIIAIRASIFGGAWP
jgi:hypothetical protein